jgi:Domain of unknown function (DUF4136)
MLGPGVIEVSVMSIRRVAFVSCVLLALGACSTPRVRYDKDARADMANYHTYAWKQPTDDATAGGQAFDNPLNLRRLRAAVEANLAKQGLQLAAAEATPDAYVTAAIGSRQMIGTENRYPVRVGLGWGYWHRGYMGALDWDTDSLYSYREGRISIDLFDAKKREAIWHASVEQDMTYLTGDKAEARINEVVAAMFAKFPGAVPPANP